MKYFIRLRVYIALTPANKKPLKFSQQTKMAYALFQDLGIDEYGSNTERICNLVKSKQLDDFLNDLPEPIVDYAMLADTTKLVLRYYISQDIANTVQAFNEPTEPAD